MAADPANVVVATGLVALASAALGPLAGPYALVVVASSAGAFIAASEVHTQSRGDVLVYVLRGVAFALAFAALLSDWTEQHFGWPAHSFLTAASVVIGYQAHRARLIIPEAVRRVFRIAPPAPDKRDPPDA